jgi:hypothetical protein
MPDYSTCGCRAHYRRPGMGAAHPLGGDRGTVPPRRLSWLLHRDRRRSQSLCRCAPSARSIRDLPLRGRGLERAGERSDNCARRRRRRSIPRSGWRLNVSDPRIGGCLCGASAKIARQDIRQFSTSERRASSKIARPGAAVCFSSSRRSTDRLAKLLTKFSGFLISWAIPAVSWPSEAIFSAWIKLAWAPRPAK